MKRKALLLMVLFSCGALSLIAQEKGMLIIDSEPSGLQVYLNGENTGSLTPFERELEPGSYTVGIRFNKFQWFRDTVEVLPNKTIEISETIKDAKFGTFVITSTPTDASVFYEGEHIGYTPFQMAQVSPGSYKFELTKDKFNRAKFEVNVKELEVSEKYVELTAGYGTMSIMTNPKADIYIDGQLEGNHVFNGRLDAGTHVIEAKKEGHKTETRIVLIKKGEEYREMFVLNAIYGGLSILSNPTGATIFLDDEEIGITPKIMKEMSIGEHKLRLEKNGFAPFETDVTIEEDRTFYVEGTLVKGIQLSTSPSEAKIFVDGNFIGTSPQVLMNLTHGKHILKIQKEGYAEVIREFVVDINNLQSTMHENLVDGVLITSEPPGASIYIDGALSGTTPKIFNDMADTSEIVLKKEGYAWVEWHQIVKDGESMLIHKDLEEGCLVDIVTPSEDGEIWIDEKYIGKKELTLPLKKGKHLIKVINSKYYNDIEKDLIVEENGMRFELELERKMSSVVVTSVPNEGMVYLNERSFLETNASKMIASDVYHLKLERKKYLTIYDTIDVFEPNQSFNYTMIPQKFRDKGTAFFLSAIFPGSGNAYLTRGKKSSIAGFLFYGLVAGSYYTHLQSEDLLDKIPLEPNLSERNNMKDEQETYALASDVMKYTAAGVWVINIIRVLAAPSEKKQFQKMGLISSYNPEISTHSVGLAYKF